MTLYEARRWILQGIRGYRESSIRGETRRNQSTENLKNSKYFVLRGGRVRRKTGLWSADQSRVVRFEKEGKGKCNIKKDGRTRTLNNCALERNTVSR